MEPILTKKFVEIIDGLLMITNCIIKGNAHISTSEEGNSITYIIRVSINEISHVISYQILNNNNKCNQPEANKEQISQVSSLKSHSFINKKTCERLLIDHCYSKNCIIPEGQSLKVSQKPYSKEMFTPFISYTQGISQDYLSKKRSSTTSGTNLKRFHLQTYDETPRMMKHKKNTENIAIKKEVHSSPTHNELNQIGERTKCKFSDKSLANSTIRKCHEKHSHTSANPYRCTYCAKSFSQTSHKKHHETLHVHGRPILPKNFLSMKPEEKPEEINTGTPRRPKRLCPWLVQVLDNKIYAHLGMEWINREQGTFWLPWPRQKRKDWKEDLSVIFLDYVKMQNSYNPDCPMEFVTWKARFRTALSKDEHITQIKTNLKQGFQKYKIDLDFDKKNRISTVDSSSETSSVSSSSSSSPEERFPPTPSSRTPNDVNWILQSSSGDYFKLMTSNMILSDQRQS